MKDNQIERLIELNSLSEEAILAVGKFVRATGDELKDVKIASIHLTEAIRDMDKTLIEIKKYIMGKEKL